MGKRRVRVVVAMCLCLPAASAALGQTTAPASNSPDLRPVSVDAAPTPSDPGPAPATSADPTTVPGTSADPAPVPSGPPSVGIRPAGSSLFALVPLAIVGAFIGVGIWTARRHPTRGIAGWLLLPAAGLVLSPLFAGIAIIMDWQALPNIPPPYVETVHAAMARNAVLGIFFLYAAICFFQKRASAPRIIKYLLLTSFVLSALLTWQYGVVFAQGAVLAAIQGLIWGLYFDRSKRVKATFGEAGQKDLEDLPPL